MNKLLALSLIALSLGQSAQSQDMSAYYEIGKVRVEESFADAAPLTYRRQGEVPTLPERETNLKVSWEKIVNVGREVWKIVDANRPVVNVKMQSSNALPEGLSHWQALEFWNEPITRAYTVTLTNLMGIDVVKFNYFVSATTGGSYQSKGKYIARVSVVPQVVEVAWGFQFDANAMVVSTVNMGTSDNPIAGQEVVVEWSVRSPLKEIRNTESYFVRGDGVIRVLSRQN